MRDHSNIRIIALIVYHGCWVGAICAEYIYQVYYIILYYLKSLYYNIYDNWFTKLCRGRVLSIIKFMMRCDATQNLHVHFLERSPTYVDVGLFNFDGLVETVVGTVQLVRLF